MIFHVIGKCRMTFRQMLTPLLFIMEIIHSGAY